MTQTSADQGELFAQVLDPANRPDPYPLYARLRESPVSLQDDGTTSSAPTPRSPSCCTTRASAPTSAKATAGLAPW